MSVLTDITSLHELQEQREDLLHMVSHDLRTPLTVVQANAQLLQRVLTGGGVEGRARRIGETIVAGARRMNVMIQDLVDSARLEAGQLRLNRKPVELRTHVLDLKERLAGALATDRIRIEVPEGLPPVSVDPDRLDRIITNLLSNALKYSPSDTEVLVGAGRAEGGIVVSVIDRGAGIPPEDLPHLFERYYRAGGTGQSEGLGLGLFITRVLVDAHGGRIWVESKPGEGSAFHFTLPLA